MDSENTVGTEHLVGVDFDSDENQYCTCSRDMNTCQWLAVFSRRPAVKGKSCTEECVQ